MLLLTEMMQQVKQQPVKSLYQQHQLLDQDNTGDPPAAVPQVSQFTALTNSVPTVTSPTRNTFTLHGLYSV
jgi:hypothetical protein